MENFTMSEELSGYKVRSFSLSFVPCFQEPIGRLQGGPVVVGTHNDLILCCATLCYQREYYICNPHKKRWVGLPPAPQCHDAVRLGFLCDAYYNKKEDAKRKHSSTSSIFNAYEYRYVVVRIAPSPTYNTRQFEVEIFSSETGEWRKSVVSHPGIKALEFLCCSPARSVTCNGMLFWSGCDGFVIRMDPFNKNKTSTASTTSGDITIDKFRFIEFNKGVDDRFHQDYCLGVWQGLLRMCELFVPRCSPTKYILNIWELKEEETAADGGDKWCLIERASTEQMVSEDPLIANWLNNAKEYMWQCITLRVLGLDPNNEEIAYLDMQKHIVICNIRTRTLKTARKGWPKSDLSAAPHWIESFPFEFPCWPTPLPSLP